ncbi:uncharacterized protein FIBRA_06688 [Fibroporia radiculosa]|uniref:HMG box domain-containing protein n=1 Tax=Fibroporia radiculosa TaxID=599839 RepID=J4HZI0_9APHY|nr:uncharacterized protein FIBRA_06688 [Fibroporia radiculosa]CCM04507.1 predicted protein [Fibroporia radiculosa]
MSSHYIPTWSTQACTKIGSTHLHPLHTQPDSPIHTQPDSPIHNQHDSLIHLPTQVTAKSTHQTTADRSQSHMPPRPSIYTSATSERRALRNRERDPDWVPRPPNAFIIFRAEYSRRHAQANKGGESTTEKTLSKRAAEAWKTLTAEHKQPYKIRAELERQEHAKKHPDYRYKPRRRAADLQKGLGSMTRREQVELFVERTISRTSSLSECDDASCDYMSPSSPTSLTSSSSPEPPETPLRDSSPVIPLRDEPRSSSMPPAHNLPTYTHYHDSSVLSLERCVSTPSLGSSAFATADSNVDNSIALSSSFIEADSVPWAAEYPDPSCNMLAGIPDSSIPSSFAFQVDNAQDNLSFETSSETAVEVPVTYGIHPSMLMARASTSGGSCPPSGSGPLSHRRRRAATASGTFPSPLTAVTSSLAGWNGSIASVTTANPDVYPETPCCSPISVPGYTGDPNVALWQNQASSSSSLIPPVAEFDLDRTPRYADFPQSVHGAYMLPGALPPAAGTDPTLNPYNMGQMLGEGTSSAGALDGTDANYKAYTQGLLDLGIEPTMYTMSPFEELDLSEFFDFNN